MSSGVLSGSPLGRSHSGAMAPHAAGGLRFVQISDSHIGFNKAANADVTGTLREAIAKVNALPTPPSFVLHTGDVTHLSKAEEFDTLAESLKSLRTDQVFYVPGEHDVFLRPF